MRLAGYRALCVPLASLLASACAGTPPADPPTPRGTTAVVTPPAPTPTETPPEEKPLLPIGVGFAADPLEPLPPGAVLRCGTRRMRVSSPQAFAVTNEGRLFAVDRARAGWVLRDVNRGVDAAPIPASREAAFTPDGTLLVAWSRTKAAELVILSVPDAKLVGTVALPTSAPKQAPGRDVATQFGMIGLLRSGDGSDDTLLMAPDGKAVVAITQDGKAHLVDLAARALVKSHVPPPKGRLVSVSNGGDRGLFEISRFGRDGSGSAFSKLIRGYQVIDLRTSKKVHEEKFKELPPDPDEPNAMRGMDHDDASFRLAPNGTFVYRRERGALSALDLSNGKEIASLDLKKAGVSDDDTFRMLGTRAALVGDRVIDLPLFTVHPTTKGFAALSPDGQIVATREGDTLHLSSGGPVLTNTLDGPVQSLAFASDNQLVIGAKTTHLHHPGTCAAGPSLQEGTRHIATAARGAVGLATEKQIVFVHSDRPSAPVSLEGAVRSLAATPEGDRWLASVAREEEDASDIRYFDAKGALDPSNRFDWGMEQRALVVSRDGLRLGMLTGGRGDPPKLWIFDLPTMAPLKGVRIPSQGPIAFAGSSLVLHAAHSEGIAVWRLPALDEVHHIHSGSCCEAIAVSPDGSRVAGVVWGGFRIWDVETRALVAEVSGAHADSISALAFSPDGQHLATGARDATVLVWRVDKLSTRPLFEKKETVAATADEAERFFANRSDIYAITAEKKLALRPGKAGVVPPLSSVTAVAGDGDAHCAIAASKVRCWGTTASGVLGVPERRAGGSVASLSAPTTVPVADPVELRMWNRYACALTRKGTLVCWGQVDLDAPVQRPEDRFFTVLSFDLGRTQRCAVTEGGGVHCWDDKQILGFYRRIDGAASVSAGFDHACLLDDKGALRCLGTNESDEVGDDTGLRRDDFVPVQGLSGVTAFTAGRFATCAVAAGGQASCWGRIGDVSLQRPTRVASLDGATALRVRDDSVCGRIASDRVDCVTLAGKD